MGQQSKTQIIGATPVNVKRTLPVFASLASCCVGLCLTACQAEEPEETSENNTSASNGSSNTTLANNQTTPASALEECSAEAGVVRFTTSDGVELVADFTPAMHQGRGAVLLFHMIPPSNDRSSYPPRVREALAALDLNVLNVDRRGAGDSGGNAQDAYTGETASLDVEAAVSFMLSDEAPCRIDAEEILLVGASNGTTSVFDYVSSRQNSALPGPEAVIWLSPGSYTEAQNKIRRSDIESCPVLIVHPDNEPWATQYNGENEAWRIIEIENGRHGTGNFDNGDREAVQLGEMVDWATKHVAR